MLPERIITLIDATIAQLADSSPWQRMTLKYIAGRQLEHRYPLDGYAFELATTTMGRITAVIAVGRN